ncbi:IS1380 family transposase [Oleiphilus messinensis]|uniref:IS1380 family transposase n=1 Tax=Oleiphilus messinensis TaxID=141451 RepID=A0A1Y0I4E2_9GAMM|nr:IS1380 family transposase [Oleiphilus messinensis]ARU55352.1 IS1380 family transposase [Oleiphilus messinensis]
MTKFTQEQLRFHPSTGKTIRADFNGGELSSDFGALLLRESMLQSDLISRLTDAINDRRHQSYIDHSLKDLLVQRVLQMACGYEDSNDSNFLRKDPMFKLAAGRPPLDDDKHLASAPTFTRLGQSMTRSDIYRMAEAFVHHFISSYERPPAAIIIDLDHTPAITHGGQQLNLFNAKYQDYCYLPLLIFEGLSGKLITAVLRPGKTPTGKENAAILKRLIQLLRKRWPKTHLLVRGDSHFAQPELMRIVQDDPNSDYVLGKGAGHKTALRPKARALLDEAHQALKIKTGLAKLNNMVEPDRLRLYGETEYQAGSWKGLDTRIIYKAEVNQQGENPRFIVTSIKEASAEAIYEDLYSPRGQDENFIKYLKNDLSGDRLSDQSFLANHLRMFYACAAYVLHYEFRTQALKGTELEKAQPSTVIMKLCKIAVRVVEYKDRIKLHLPSRSPFETLLRHVTESFYPMPARRSG